MHPVPTQAWLSPSSTSLTREGHLLQLMNLQWHIIVTQSPQFTLGLSLGPGYSISSVLFSLWLFVTPRTAANQASLSITNSRGLLKLMSIESVMPSHHLILCRALLLLHSTLPSIRAFPMSHFFTSGGQNTVVSASASVLPMNIQYFRIGWFDSRGSIGLDKCMITCIHYCSTIQSIVKF